MDTWVSGVYPVPAKDLASENDTERGRPASWAGVVKVGAGWKDGGARCAGKADKGGVAAVYVKAGAV